MPRELAPLESYLQIPAEQRTSRKLYQVAGFFPQLPSGFKDRRRLRRNLEVIGLGRHFIYFPWTLTSSTLVEELTSAAAIPPELQGNVYRNNLTHFTLKQLGLIYGLEDKGEERPRASNAKLHKGYFNMAKDSTDGYPLSACTNREMRDVFGFICPIFDPTRKDKVHIYRFNQVYLALHGKVKVNWARHFYRTIQKWGESLGKAGKPSHLSTILLHYYHFFGALTGPEEQRYSEALAHVQGQVEQIAPLRPPSPEVPLPRTAGTLSHLNPSSVPTNTPRQARTRDAGDGSVKPGGSQQTTPKPRTEPDSPIIRRTA
jgi:hypothetical protein